MRGQQQQHQQQQQQQQHNRWRNNVAWMTRGAGCVHRWHDFRTQSEIITWRTLRAWSGGSYSRNPENDDRWWTMEVGRMSEREGFAGLSLILFDIYVFFFVFDGTNNGWYWSSLTFFFLQRFATELAGRKARRRAWDGLGEEMARAGWFDA
ncbi:hypothetical protein B0F90DRAFT_1017223 [Multifurca ochricompacta]|uniref:Uncharacterized protein n=1 Tax=Multifurca ochricompacta TaxID=376703 RepID=A0AAD4M1X9_9AGAM|nr:hypothetical protein B0F90DRAFT_1017223 [Multifurca ochricompacta]